MTGFSDFWAAYPKKVGKAAAQKKWQAKNLDDKAMFIVEHVKKRAKDDKRWLDGFTLDPATFINQERWDDDYERVRAKVPYDKKPEESAITPYAQRCQWQAWANKRMLAATMQAAYQGFKVDGENQRFALLAKIQLGERLRREFGDSVNLDAHDFKARHPEVNEKLVKMSKQAFAWFMEKVKGTDSERNTTSGRP